MDGGSRGFKQGWATHARPFFRSRTCRNQQQIWVAPPLPHSRLVPRRSFYHDSTTTARSAITVQCTVQCTIQCTSNVRDPNLFPLLSVSFPLMDPSILTCILVVEKDPRHPRLSMSSNRAASAQRHNDFVSSTRPLISSVNGHQPAQVPSEAFPDRRAAELLTS